MSPSGSILKKANTKASFGSVSVESSNASSNASNSRRLLRAPTLGGRFLNSLARKKTQIFSSNSVGKDESDEEQNQKPKLRLKSLVKKVMIPLTFKKNLGSNSNSNSGANENAISSPITNYDENYQKMQITISPQHSNEEGFSRESSAGLINSASMRFFFQSNKNRKKVVKKIESKIKFSFWHVFFVFWCCFEKKDPWPLLVEFCWVRSLWTRGARRRRGLFRLSGLNECELLLRFK